MACPLVQKRQSDAGVAATLVVRFEATGGGGGGGKVSAMVVMVVEEGEEEQEDDEEEEHEEAGHFVSGQNLTHLGWMGHVWAHNVLCEHAVSCSECEDIG